MGSEDPWYAQLRRRWQPERVRLLLIGESAPDDHGDPSRRRFFYSDTLGADNLFRGVMAAMYGIGAEELQSTGKRPWLERLRDDGFFLIDLVPYPVNASQAHLRRARREHVADCVARAATLAPEGIIVVKTDVYPLLAQPLRDAGLPLLHDRGIPFPLGNTRAEFVAGFRAARQ